MTPAAPARPPLAAAALAALLAACAPPGGDLQQGTLEIGDQGGTVAAPAGPAAGASVTVPAGALEESAVVTVGPGTDVEIAGVEPVGPAVELRPHGTQFAEPVEVTLPWSAIRLPPGLSAGDLVVVKRDDSTDEVAVLEPKRVDAAGGLVVFEMSSFSTAQAGAARQGSKCLDDRLEDDDSQATGRWLRSFPAVLSGLKACPNDEDWFRLTLQPGKELKVVVTWPANEGALYLKLRDQSSRDSLAGTSGGTAAGGKRSLTSSYRIRAGSAPAKEIGIVIDSMTSRDSGPPGVPYSLTVTVTNDPRPPLATGPCRGDDDQEDNDTHRTGVWLRSFPYSKTGLKACPNDSDWFRLTLLPGQKVKAEVTWPVSEGSVFLNLVDATSRYALAASSSVPAAGGKAGRESSYGVRGGSAQAEEVAILIGAHLTQDIGTPGVPYDLTVRITADPRPPLATGACGRDDDQEDNDTQATGVWLRSFPTSKSGLKACPNDFDWFRLTLQPGQQVQAEVRWPRSEGALFINLLDRSGLSSVAPSSGGLPGGGDQSRRSSYRVRAGSARAEEIGIQIGSDGDLDIGTPGVPYALTITSNGGPAGPVAGDDAFATDEAVPILLELRNNDYAPSGRTYGIKTVATPGRGTAVKQADERVLYTPAARFHGTDTFAYTIEDSSGATASGTVTVTVRSVNDPPAVVDDTASTDEDTPVDVSVLANDSDPDGDRLMVRVTRAPARGSATLDASGAVRYVPGAELSGADSFQYTVSDGQGGSGTATVRITVRPVNDPPVCRADRLTLAEDTAVLMDVLANDRDVEGQALALSAVADPPHGAASIRNSRIRYVPNADYFGADAFSYTARDAGGATGTGTVAVTVTGVNDPPVAHDDTGSTRTNGAVTVFVLVNDGDPDREALAVRVTAAPSHGRATVRPAGAIDYVPDGVFVGVDRFTYEVRDGAGATDTAIVTVTVLSANRPPVAVEDVAWTDEDTPAVIRVLANDSDPDLDSLFVANVGAARHGTTTLQPGGDVRYVPDAEFDGVDGFEYTLTDRRGGTAIGTVVVTVTFVNDPPVANPDLVGTDEDVAVEVDPLANDTDPDNDPLQLLAVGVPAHGGVAFNLFQRIDYTPDPDWSGTDSFTYRVADQRGAASTGTVQVTVAPVNDPPAASDDAYRVRQGEELVVATEDGVLLNDRDPDGDRLTAVLVQPTDHGPVALHPDGGFLYLPEPDFVGEDRFTYVADDSQAMSAPATVRITVEVGQQPGPAYGFVHLGFLGEREHTEAKSINLHGHVAGTGLNAADETRPFRYGPDPGGGPDLVLLDLGTLGGRDGEGSGINDAGHVVGNTLTAEWDPHAFLWDGAQMVDLGTLGGPASFATAISNSGLIAGESSLAGGARHAVLWDGGGPLDLGTLGGEESVAWDVNDAGQVVGESSAGMGTPRGFLWEAGEMRDVGDLGAPLVMALGINAAGAVVGVSERPDGSFHAFLRPPQAPGEPDPALLDLGRLGGIESMARDVNAHGQVVGETDVDGEGGLVRVAFVWLDGELLDLNEVTELPPGIRLGAAWGINDVGQITGTTFSEEGGVLSWRLDPG